MTDPNNITGIRIVYTFADDTVKEEIFSGVGHVKGRVDMNYNQMHTMNGRLFLPGTGTYSLEFQFPTGDPYAKAMRPPAKDEDLARAQAVAEQKKAELAELQKKLALEDIFLWADGTWCYREDFEEYSHMSDDYETIPFGSDAWDEFDKGEVPTDGEFSGRFDEDGDVGYDIDCGDSDCWICYDTPDDD